MSDKSIKAPLWTRLVFGTLAKIPMPIMHILGDALGWVYYVFDKRHRGITLRNIARVFPDKPKAERILLAKRTFKQMGRTLLEIPYVFMTSRENLLKHVEVQGKEVLKDALAQQKGVFLLAAHISNWELMGLIPSILGYKSSSLYRPLNQAPLERFTFASRTRFGSQMYSRKEKLRWLFKALKDNHCIGVAIDQHMGAGNGIRVPFLGHLASTTQLPVPFVHRNQTPLIGMALIRQENTFKFILKFWKIVPPETIGDKTRDEVAVMTAACKSFDDVIKENPEQWLWMHRRWRAVETDESMEQVVHGAP